MGLHVWKRVAGLDLITFILPSKSNNKIKRWSQAACCGCVLGCCWAFFSTEACFPSESIQHREKAALNCWLDLPQMQQAEAGLNLCFRKALEFVFFGFFFPLSPPALRIKINPQALQQDQIFSWTKIPNPAFHRRFSSFVYKSVTPVLGPFFQHEKIATFCKPVKEMNAAFLLLTAGRNQ